MKKLILTAALAIAGISSAAEAGPSPYDYDGCYQLYTMGAMFPAFCLQGTAEEGIAGSSARLTIFKTNTAKVAACRKSSTIEVGMGTFTFNIAGRPEMILKNVTTNNELKSGEAVFGSTTLKFTELSGEPAKRLSAIAATECR
ncbi:MAG TPA: hypothetical protein VFV50_16845 [Bdellovibrionales bacterium]|nr:hypothetical protein [Bdellovibrionales bacterium]